MDGEEMWWNISGETENFTDLTWCESQPECWYDSAIWPSAALLTVLLPLILVSILLNTMTVVTLIKLKSIKLQVRLSLGLISFSYAIIEGSFLVNDWALMNRVLRGPYQPLSLLHCYKWDMGQTTFYNMAFYLFIVLAVERYFDNRRQIMSDAIDYKLVLGILGALALSLLTSTSFLMTSQTFERCSCLCSSSEVSWVEFTSTHILYIGGIQLLMMAVFVRIRHINRHLLAQFDLLATQHSLNERHAQKKRVQTAHLLLNTVPVAGVGNLLTVITLTATKLIPASQEDSYPGHGHLVMHLLAHMFNALYHSMHVICLYRYCPVGFASLMRTLLCINKCAANVTVTVTPAVEDYHVDAAQSMQMIENMWKERGWLKPPTGRPTQGQQEASTSGV